MNMRDNFQSRKKIRAMEKRLKGAYLKWLKTEKNVDFAWIKYLTGTKFLYCDAQLR